MGRLLSKSRWGRIKSQCIRPIIYIHFIMTFILFFAYQVALELCKPLLRLCQLWYFAN